MATGRPTVTTDHSPTPNNRRSLVKEVAAIVFCGGPEPGGDDGYGQVPLGPERGAGPAGG